jgi:hypothetical protein
MKITQEYSVKRISETLLLEVKKALKDVNNYGSVEIFVQDGVVTQITVRNIKKTSRNGSRVSRA